MHTTESQQRERISTEIFKDADAASHQLAGEIAALIRERAAAGKHVVLGLATGSTPVRLYRELVRLHREEGLSFKNVITFNLDEYYGLPRDHSESYWCFMHEQLFDHIDILPDNINLPSGTMPRSEVFAACRVYEDKIVAAGGLDLQLLGIGRTGHIGFNEPGSTRDSRTRLIALDALTRRDAARNFSGEVNVPRHAVTMGVGTILDARRIVLLAWGESKARVLAQAVEAEMTDSLPASFLQGHPNVSFYIDGSAASGLTRMRYPWLVGPVEWTSAMARRAVVWLARTMGCSVLKLLDEHYSEHGMSDLLIEQGPVYDLNIRIFNELQHTITGWPGGKPGADDACRPERAEPAVKRVVVFSPEPSHDVLGMGGTLRRLVDQGHEVTVVYLTSGNLAVPDNDALMATEIVADLANCFTGETGAVETFAGEVRTELLAKSVFEGDSAKVRRLKGLVRRGEARAALRSCGVSSQNMRFLDLPFYEQARNRQFKSGAEDLQAITAVLSAVQPHQVFVTGDRDDPSSVTAMTFTLVSEVFRQADQQEWFAHCRVWLYRGMNTPWDAAEVDMAVPLSPHELTQKTQSIFPHRSQRSNSAVAAGLREPWQQAEQQNRALAEVYDALGLADYEAIEGFSRWEPEA